MRKELFASLAIVGTVALSLALFTTNNPKSQTNFLQQESTWLDGEFAKYITRFGKTYATKEEYLYRRTLFEQQLAFIGELSSRNDATVKYRVGLNRFSDLSDEEFASRYLGDSGKPEPEGDDKPSLQQAPVVAPIDWRDKGVVGAVKDQGRCGSCWSFSTVGPVEENYAIKYGKQIVLSEQQLVDCSWDYGNAGCNGGLFAQGYQYVQDFGLELAADYPYLASDGNCTYDGSKVAVNIVGTVQADRSPQGLKQLLATGPASISLHASDPTFRAYTGGIYNNPDCPTTVNHAVQSVGWGHDSESGLDYFIVRNSWSASWGDKGYIKIAESNTTLGICGMLYRVPMLPIIA